MYPTSGYCRNRAFVWLIDWLIDCRGGRWEGVLPLDPESEARGGRFLLRWFMCSRRSGSFCVWIAVSITHTTKPDFNIWLNCLTSTPSSDASVQFKGVAEFDSQIVVQWLIKIKHAGRLIYDLSDRLCQYDEGVVDWCENRSMRRRCVTCEVSGQSVRTMMKVLKLNNWLVSVRYKHTETSVPCNLYLIRILKDTYAKLYTRKQKTQTYTNPMFGSFVQATAEATSSQFSSELLLKSILV